MGMKDEIRKFERRNGRSEYSQKDLLKYLIVKVDKIHNKVSEGEGKIRSIRARVDVLQKFMFSIFGILAVVITLVITLKG